MRYFYSLVLICAAGWCSLAQNMPKEILNGKVRIIKDSVTIIAPFQSYGELLLHDNTYHHHVSFEKVDSLFNRKWWLTATSPYHISSTTFDRYQQILQREWYDPALEYKFKENFVYYKKDHIQFYELKNIPFVHSIKNEKGKLIKQLRFSNYYDRKAYFEYSESDYRTFEMNQDDFFQMKKFYYEYDLENRLSTIKHFNNGQWLWTENAEYDTNSVYTYLFLNKKRFPFLIEQETKDLENNTQTFEYSLIPKGSLYKRPRSKKILFKNDEDKIIKTEYWFNKSVGLFEYEYQKELFDSYSFKDNIITKETTIGEQPTILTTTSFNSQNKLAAYRVYSATFNKLLEEYKFQYNAQGHIIEVQSYEHQLENGITLNNQINFKYTYDSTGNWITQEKFVNGTPVSERYREITYYSSRISQ